MEDLWRNQESAEPTARRNNTSELVLCRADRGALFRSSAEVEQQERVGASVGRSVGFSPRSGAIESARSSSRR